MLLVGIVLDKLVEIDAVGDIVVELNDTTIELEGTNELRKTTVELDTLLLMEAKLDDDEELDPPLLLVGAEAEDDKRLEKTTVELDKPLLVVAKLDDDRLEDIVVKFDALLLKKAELEDEENPKVAVELEEIVVKLDEMLLVAIEVEDEYRLEITLVKLDALLLVEIEPKDEPEDDERIEVKVVEVGELLSNTLEEVAELDGIWLAEVLTVLESALPIVIVELVKEEDIELLCALVVAIVVDEVELLLELGMLEPGKSELVMRLEFALLDVMPELKLLDVVPLPARSAVIALVLLLLDEKLETRLEKLGVDSTLLM